MPLLTVRDDSTDENSSSGDAHGDTRQTHVKREKPMIAQHTPRIGDQEYHGVMGVEMALPCACPAENQWKQNHPH